MKNKAIFLIVVLGMLAVILAGARELRAETLEESWKVATAVSHRLRAERHGIEAARETLVAAKAARYPTLSNRTSYMALSESLQYQMQIPEFLPGILPPLTLSTPLSEQSFGISTTTVTVPLFTGGRIKSSIDANRYLVNAARAGYATSFLDIKMEVAEAYFNVLRTRRLLEVARNAESSLYAHQNDVKKLLEQKMVTRNALLAAQTAWSAAAQEVLKAENLNMTAESAFNRYLGRPLDFPVFIEEVEVPETSENPAFLTAEALRCRKELTQVASQSQAAQAMSKVAHGDRLPQVVAIAGHNYMQNSAVQPESLLLGGVALQWTPLDGGSSRARERAAAQTAAAAARMRAETRSLIELQVRTAWISERETRSRIKVAELGKEQADENLRVVTRQFQEGLVNHTEVLDAQTQQTAAWTNLADAKYDAVIATYRLRHAIGHLY